MRILQKSWLWNLVPLAGRNRFSTTLGKTIFLTPKAFKDFSSPLPSVSTLALVEHEKVHVKQYRDEGIPFLFKYFFLPSHRFRYEIEAFAVQISVLSQARPHKRGEYTEEKARLLSSPFPYLLFVSYGKALLALMKRIETQSQ